MVAGTFEELISLSWDDMVKQIPDPPQRKKDSTRTRRASIATPKARRAQRKEVVPESNVSFASQKMNIFCTQPELESGPRKLANSMLLSLSPEKTLENLQKIYGTYYNSLSTPSAQRKGSFSSFLKKKSSGSTSISSKAPVIEVSNFKINFGLQEGTLCPLHENMTAEITVNLKAGKGRFFWYLPDPDPAYQLELSPMSGTFKKKGEQTFSITLNFNSSVNLRELISLEVPGVGRFFFLIALESEHSVFGEDIRQYYENGKAEIPPALVAMKEFIVVSNGFQLPNIFMTPGKEDEILTIRDKLNRDMFYDCRDVHSLAKTLVAWFDEQTPKLLQGISEGLFLSAGGQQESLSVLEMLKEPNRTIMIWLINLIVDVVIESDHNGVDIVEISNLFSEALYSPVSADSAKNAQLPGCVSKTIQHLVNYHAKLRS